jgi:membrane fusion protein, protease secretion system
MNPDTPTSQVPAPRPASDPAVDVEQARLSDTRGPIRLGFWVLVVGFGLFLLWAAYAPLDEGVSASAVVSVETRRQPIQHMQGGVVKRLAVKEGAEVAAGDVLVELDQAVGRANYENTLQVYLTQRALEGRLLAESTGASAISFHPDLLKSTDPLAAQHMALQQQLFASRRASQNADVAALQETVNGLEQQIVGMRQVLAGQRSQQALQGKQLEAVRALAEEGFAPRNQALQLEQSQAQLNTALSEMESNIRRLQSSLAEARLRVAQRRQEYAKEVSGNLSEVQGQVQANQEKLAAVDQELQRMQIKAPIAGQVIALDVSGPGSVVAAGHRLMDILPRGETMLLDVKIPPHVIDRVAVGNEVEVRFSAFSSTPHLVVLGKLISLSGDAVTESVNGMTSSHYHGRVELTPAGLKALGNQVVQPGMTAEVLVKSGERSLLTYLMHPLTKRIAASMTEE